MVDSAVAEGAS